MADAPALGDVLDGKYRLVREIAAGAMGRLVEAEHLLLERPVAIKLVLRAPDERTRRRVLREAQAARTLSSEHVVRVFDVGMVGDAPYIVMELLEGCDLAALVEQRGPLPIPEAVDYVIQACVAVVEAHAAGIIHRDIKPSNLFLGRTAAQAPLLKVLDFGISKLADVSAAEHAETELTGEGAMLGSPYYMSPEQLRNPTRVDGRTDVWALAVTLFHLLSGAHPFDGATVNEVSAAIHTDPPRELLALRPEMPAELAGVIERALAKRPEQRTESAAAFARELRPFASPRGRLAAERLETAPSPAPPIRLSDPVILRAGDLTATDAAQTRTAEPVDAAPAPRRATLIAAALVIAAALAVLGIYGWPEPAQTRTDDPPSASAPPAADTASPVITAVATAEARPASAPEPPTSAPAPSVRAPPRISAPRSAAAHRPAVTAPAASSAPPAAPKPNVDKDGVPIPP